MMMNQLRQKLKYLILNSKSTPKLYRNTQYNLSQVAKSVEDSTKPTKSMNIEFKSLTKNEISHQLREIVSDQLLANQLNNIEQQAVNHLTLNQDDLTNLMLILQIMLSNNRASTKVLEIAHTILHRLFEKVSEKKDQLDKQVQVFQQLVPLLTKTDRFEHELLIKLYKFFENDVVLQQFTPFSQLHILKVFFQKGIVQIPQQFWQNKLNLSFSDFVDLIWIKTLANKQIDSSQLQQLQLFLQNQPSLKNIPKPIQYKLKEISISQDLGESSLFIKQLDDFVTKESETSLIQDDCEIILRVLKWNYKTEVLIDPYTVDFIADIPLSKKKIVIEMNGPSHYPFLKKKDILSGKDQMKIKNLLLKNYIPAVIHHQEWSETKGVTGKIDYIKKIINQSIKNHS